MDNINETLERIEKLIDVEEYETAEKQVQEYIEANPQDLYARRVLMKIYSRQKQFDNLERAATETLRVDPCNLIASSQLINVYTSRSQFSKAKKLAQEILELYPDNIPVRNQLVTIYKAERNLFAAEKLLQEILELDPEDIRTRCQLIVIYKIWDERDKVGRLAHEIIQRNPDDMRARKYLKYYKPLGNETEPEDKKSDGLSIIQNYRKRLYNGEISVTDLTAIADEIKDLPQVERTLLMAEMYAHHNMPDIAITHLKRGLKQEDLSDANADIYRKAINLVKSKNINPIKKRLQFEGLKPKER